MIRTNHKSRYKSKIDWGRRYPDNWGSQISPACIKSTHNICCHCWIKESKESHHTRYRFLFLRIRRWGIGIFLFPLCYQCHDKAHDKPPRGKRVWIKNKKAPLWGNKNTLKFNLNLIIRYWLLRLILLIRGK